jgi:hypothetical protein
MPHGKIQLMFVCPSLNVALIEAPPSTNLQQHTSTCDCQVHHWCFYINSS